MLAKSDAARVHGVGFYKFHPHRNMSRAEKAEKQGDTSESAKPLR
jgi:hypothetical protein